MFILEIVVLLDTLVQGQITIKAIVMKIKLIIPFILALCCASLTQAQRGPEYSDRYSFRNSDNNRFVTNDRYRTNDRYFRHMDRLNRHDRRHLQRLVRKLDNLEWYAWEDGFIGRRERRAINAVRDDINYLLYGRRNNRNRRTVINIGSRNCR